MANVTVSSTIDALLQSADAAEAKTAISAATAGSVSALSSNALVLAEKEWPIKTVTWATNQTLTYSGGTNTAGDGVIIQANVTTQFVLTVTPTSSTIYRNGAVTSLSGTITVPVGKHRFVFWTPDDGTTLYMEDTVFAAVDVPVAATPTNYTAATPDVEAHLAAIDTALGNSAGSNLLFKVGSTSAALSNTASETSVFTGTVPGGTLGSDGCVRFSMHGRIQNNSGGSLDLRIRLKYGSTTLFEDTVTGAITSNSNLRYWRMDGAIYGAGTTGTQTIDFRMTYSGTYAAPAAGYGKINATDTICEGGGTSSEDSTADKTLAVTFTCGNYTTPNILIYTLGGFAAKV